MKQGLLKFMISKHECAGFKVAMPTTEEEKQYLSKFRDDLKTGDFILNDTVYPAYEYDCKPYPDEFLRFKNLCSIFFPEKRFDFIHVVSLLCF